MSAPSAHHRTDIQGLRGIAVLLVVLFHAHLGASGGFVGVDVFFVLSGFVITLNLMRELKTTQTLNLMQFYTRRFRRLLPAAALMSAVTLLASVVFLSPDGSQQVAAYTAVAASTFIANIYLMGWGHDYFAGSAELNPFLHTWSLSVEEQFYAVLPGIAWLVWRFGKDRNPLVIFRRVVVAVGAASLAFSAWCAWTTQVLPVPASQLGFYLPLSRAWEFALGTWLAMTPVRQVSARAATLVASLGMCLVVGAGLFLHEGPHFPGVIALVPVMGTILLLWSAPASALWNSILSHRSLTWLGDISYSWYLWHWPFIVFLPMAFPDAGTWLLALGGAIALLPAWMSWRWVEVPIRGNTRLSGLRLLPRLALWMLGPIALAVGLRAGAVWGWGLDVPEGWALRPAAHEAPCGDGAWGATPAEQCRLGPTEPQGHVLLLGDSHASSLAEGVEAALTDRELGVWVAWKARCPFALGRWNNAAQGCQQFQDRMWDLIDEQPPAAVIIANRHSRYLSVDVANVAAAFQMTDGSGAPADTDSRAAASYIQGVQDAVAELRNRGIPVIVVVQVPEFPPFTNRLSLWNEGSLDSPELSASELAAQRALNQPVYSGLPGPEAGVVLLDPAPAFCDADRCLATLDDTWAYLDYNHLNPVGSLHLQPLWRAAFDTLLGPVVAVP